MHSGRIMSRFRIAFVLAAAAAHAASIEAVAAPPAPEVHSEVKQLLAYLETSGCRFFRNGKWYEAPEASAHLQRKYDYLVKRGLIARTEDFIERAATRSSVSGDPYRVRCGSRDAVEGATWLNEELRRYRASHRAGK